MPADRDDGLPGAARDRGDVRRRFFLWTLYHLRYPMLALDLLSSVCTRQMIVESAILDDFSPYNGGIGKGYPGEMVMEFYPDKEYGNNDTNWWSPSLVCLGHMVRAAGFDDVEAWKLTDKPEKLPMCRGFVRGKKTVASESAGNWIARALGMTNGGKQ
jgi:tRNA (mo5U34)-methyltransferase